MKYIDIKKEFNYTIDAEKQWIRLKLRWYSLLHANGGRCIKCGESNFSCLEFHHRDPNVKDDQISNLIMGNGGWDKAKSEATKCDILCRNCHYELHYKQTISNRKIKLFNMANRYICEVCNYNKKQCLDFHHMYGKDFTIGKINVGDNSGKGRKYLDISLIDKVREELSKCKVVCKNCHKKLHMNKERMDKWGNLLMELSKEYDSFGMIDHISNVIEFNKATIKELYWFGDSIRSIMKYLGIENRGGIRVHFNKCISSLGLVRKPKEVRQPKEIKEKKINLFSIMSDEKIIMLWNDTSIKFTKDIAKEFGVSIGALNARMARIRKEYDNILNRREFVKQFGKEYLQHRIKRVELNDIERKLIELREQGKSSKEVAEVVGLTPVAVRLKYSRLIKRGFIEAIPKEWSNHWNK